MEHSKLPWKKGDFKNNYRGIVDADGETILIISWNAPKADEDIDLILEACNAHAKLKAKAELFDKIAAHLAKGKQL